MRREIIEGSALQRKVTFPKTHTIEVLLDLLKKQGISIPNGVVKPLNCLNTLFKPVTKAEARRALEQASLVLAWVESQLER